MPGTFNLELSPGRQVALDVICTSDELDMSKMEDGTIVGGSFFGRLNIVHSHPEHYLSFTGTRVEDDGGGPPPLITMGGGIGGGGGAGEFDSKALTRLLRKEPLQPIKAKCYLKIYTPELELLDVVLSFAKMWHSGNTYPEAENMEGNRMIWKVRANPGSVFEHLGGGMMGSLSSTLYYEALPDPSAMDLDNLILPQNGFAMPVGFFILHIGKVLRNLGLSVNMQTVFMQTHLNSFLPHRFISYRFLRPHRISAAVEISLQHATPQDDAFQWTRIFLLWKGISEEELGAFMVHGRGDKEGLEFNWREVVGVREEEGERGARRVSFFL